MEEEPGPGSKVSMTAGFAIVSARLMAEGKLLSVDGSFFVVFFLFLILIAILNRLVFKPVLSVLAERERLTTGAVREAVEKIEALRGEAERYEHAMRVSRAEAYRDLERLRKEALAERGRQLESVKSDISADVAARKTEIESQTVAAKDKLKTEALELARQISSTLLQRPLKGTNG